MLSIDDNDASTDDQDVQFADGGSQYVEIQPNEEVANSMLTVTGRCIIADGSYGDVYDSNDHTQVVKEVEIPEDAWSAVAEICITSRRMWTRQQQEVLAIHSSYNVRAGCALIGFERFEITLEDYIESQCDPLQDTLTNSSNALIPTFSLAASRLQKSSRELEVALSIMTGMAAGLQHLHSIGWVHGDLSSRNVMLTKSDSWDYDRKMHARLIDFGTAHVYTSNTLQCPILNSTSVAYAAPERMGPVVCPQLSCHNHLPASDMWSLGCIFADMMLNSTNGYPPILGWNHPLDVDYSRFFEWVAVKCVITKLYMNTECGMLVAKLICDDLLPHMWKARHQDRLTAEQVGDVLRERQCQPLDSEIRKRDIAHLCKHASHSPRRKQAQAARCLPTDSHAISAVADPSRHAVGDAPAELSTHLSDDECKEDNPEHNKRRKRDNTPYNTDQMIQFYTNFEKGVAHGVAAALWVGLGESLSVDGEVVRLLMPALHIAWVHTVLYRKLSQDPDKQDALFMAVFFAAVCVTISSFVDDTSELISRVGRLIATVKNGDHMMDDFINKSPRRVITKINRWAAMILKGMWLQQTWSRPTERELQCTQAKTSWSKLPVMDCLISALTDDLWRTVSREWRSDPGCFDRSFDELCKRLKSQQIKRVAPMI
jgi:serine/threonine protein kinase